MKNVVKHNIIISKCLIIRQISSNYNNYQIIKNNHIYAQMIKILNNLVNKKDQMKVIKNRIIKQWLSFQNLKILK